MKSLGAWDAQVAAAVHTVVSDIDDTLTTQGRLTAQAYSALEALQNAGLRVVLTTGRPAGWCDHIARMWPVDAVVGENGAFFCWFDRALHKLRTRQFVCEAARAGQRERIMALGHQLVQAVPGVQLASDQFCRLYDLAIDYCEDVAPVGAQALHSVVDIMQAAGMQVKVSSIHVNGWFGNHDKLSTTRILVQELFDTELETCQTQMVYVGDSPNDEPMFQFFSNSIGVANVQDFASQLHCLPRYVTQSRGGAGFAEVAHFLLTARAA